MKALLLAIKVEAAVHRWSRNGEAEGKGFFVGFGEEKKDEGKALF